MKLRKKRIRLFQITKFRHLKYWGSFVNWVNRLDNLEVILFFCVVFFFVLVIANNFLSPDISMSSTTQQNIFLWWSGKIATIDYLTITMIWSFFYKICRDRYCKKPQGRLLG